MCVLLPLVACTLMVGWGVKAPMSSKAGTLGFDESNLPGQSCPCLPVLRVLPVAVLHSSGGVVFLGRSPEGAVALYGLVKP